LPRAFFVTAERASLARLAYGTVGFEPEPPVLPASGGDATDADFAITEIVRGWMDAIGPTTALALAERIGVPGSRVRVALARLESEGSVLQGRFAEQAKDAEVEWCERGLLARIHRLTIGRLRREIEPVSKTDFMRFLFRWQHVLSGSRLHGRDGVRATVAQLEGLELPGPAWERDVLPARVERYDPADLEQLCLSGEVAWGRLGIAPAPAEEPPRARRRRRVITRSAPLAFFLRQDMHLLLEPLPEESAWLEYLSAGAIEVLEHLRSRGASFLADISRVLKRLPTQVEDALWELVASGLVTGDGIAGLRTLLLPDDKRKTGRRSRLLSGAHLHAVPGRHARRRLMPVGRWSLLRHADDATPDRAEAVTGAAERLLARWGVVFRELCAREHLGFPWRVLLHELRRMEACGAVRGGRFVDGFVGEQFALPEAVETLRRVRRDREAGDTIVVSAADPLNLTGIVTPGERVSPFTLQVIAYREGTPIEIGELGAVRSRLQ
jgi:ATP-dependent Lhr-like helicase